MKNITASIQHDLIHWCFNARREGGLREMTSIGTMNSGCGLLWEGYKLLCSPQLDRSCFGGTRKPAFVMLLYRSASQHGGPAIHPQWRCLTVDQV